MFQKITSASNFSKVTQRLYVIALIAVSLLFGSNLLWAIGFWTSIRHAHQTVFVRNGKSMFSANLDTENDKRNIYQARGLVELFAKLVFEADARNFKERLHEGLLLMTKMDGDALYNTFLQHRVLEKYNNYNSYSTVRVDSLIVNDNVLPYKCMLLAVQEFHYDDEVEANPFGVVFDLEPSLYSEINPYGMQIHNFNFIIYTPHKNP